MMKPRYRIGKTVHADLHTWIVTDVTSASRMETYIYTCRRDGRVQCFWEDEIESVYFDE